MSGNNPWAGWPPGSSVGTADALLTTTGPTVLPIGAIADGSTLVRSGNQIIGVIRPVPPSSPDKDLDMFGPVTLAGGVGVTVNIPGPAVGFIRFFDVVQVLTPVGGGNAGPINWFLNCSLGARQFQRNAAAAQINRTGVPPLKNGESIDVVNGGANPGVVTGSFIDVPATGFTVVRQVLTAVLADVIPVPAAANLQRQWTAQLQSLDLTYNFRGVVQCFNEDTVPHTCFVTQNGLVTARTSGPTAALGGFSPTGSVITPVSIAYTAQRWAVGEAVVTRGPFLYGVYTEVTR